MPTSGNLNGVAIDAVTGNIVCVGLSTVGAGDQQLTIVVLDASGNAYGNFNHGSPFALSMVFTQASVGTWSPPQEACSSSRGATRRPRTRT